MLDNVEVLIHSSIRINKGLVIYFDPYKINKDYNDADIVFIPIVIMIIIQKMI